jgi:hypothetical protein
MKNKITPNIVGLLSVSIAIIALKFRNFLHISTIQ